MKSTDNITDGDLYCCPACTPELFQRFCIFLYNGTAWFWSHVEGATDEICDKDHTMFLERVEPRVACTCDKNIGEIKYLQFRLVGGKHGVSDEPVV